MQVFMIWRSGFMRTSMIAAAASRNHLAMFHSTDACFGKRRTKFGFVQQDVKGSQKPSKNHVRFSVREKGADKKKAIQSILCGGGRSTAKAESFSKIGTDYEEKLEMRRSRKAKAASRKKMISKLRKEKCLDDFDDECGGTFHASFGKHGFTWTYRPSGMGLDWSDFSHRNYNKPGEAHSSRFDSGSNPCIIGSYEDRRTLGLPTAGRLRVEDVKSAFHVSALKWHPDKHQEASSRAAAEEKFKNCVTAYKSLCDALSAR